MPNTLLTLTPTRQARTSEAISFIISQITSNDSSTCSKGIKQVQFIQNYMYSCIRSVLCIKKSTVLSQKYTHHFLLGLRAVRLWEGMGILHQGTVNVWTCKNQCVFVSTSYCSIMKAFFAPLCFFLPPPPSDWGSDSESIPTACHNPSCGPAAQGTPPTDESKLLVTTHQRQW